MNRNGRNYNHGNSHGDTEGTKKKLGGFVPLCGVLLILALAGLGFIACDTGAETPAAPETPKTVAPPSAPGGVTATTNIDGITVKWNAVTGAAEYKVYVMKGAETEKTLLATVNDVQLTSYTWTHAQSALSPRTDYRYTVTALNAAGTESAFSVRGFAATPSVPIGADPAREDYPTFDKVEVDRATISQSEGVITLTWDPVPGAVLYKIYWNMWNVEGVGGEMDTHFAGLVRAPLTTCTVTGLTMTPDGRGHEVVFYITTVNMFGESDIARSSVGSARVE
jgi:hypothetical protein